MRDSHAARGTRRTRVLGPALAGASLCLALPASAWALPPDIPDRSAFETDGNVNAIARGGGLTFIGGSFTEVRARTGGGVRLDPSTGQRVTPVANVANLDGVNASAPDGSGGYFIGGKFSHVGGVRRSNIAHILADGSVDPAFNPSANKQVTALAVSGGAVYVGGDFDKISGLDRRALAKLSATSGNAFSAWNPDPTDGAFFPRIEALAVSGSEVYVGGAFTSIGGLDRNNIAKLSATTGNAFSAWNPDAESPVRALAVADGAVYVGGEFVTIDGLTRGRIAKLSATTGNAFSAWDPNARGLGLPRVEAIVPNASAVYVGGEFTSIGGLDRNNIAKLSATSGNAFSSFNPNADGVVETLAVSGGAVFPGGSFSTIGGQQRRLIAKLSTTSGDAFAAFNPSPDGFAPVVRTISVSDSTMFAGGRFETVNPVARANLAALDSTGTPTALKADSDGPVRALAADDSGNVYVGGAFTSIGGLDRNNIARLSAASGNAFSAWNPDANNDVHALALADGAVYAGGRFNTGADDGAPDISIGGQPRNGIAKLSAASGNAFSAWNPDANNTVRALAVDDTGNVYVGGEFRSIGGQPRNGIAKLSATTGNAFSAWNPDAESPVRALAVADGAVYVGGEFNGANSIGGQDRDFIAKLSATSGNAFSAWNPDANDSVFALAADATAVYVGGEFAGVSSIGGQNRNKLAALSPTSGNAFSLFNPDMRSSTDISVQALAVDGGALFAGGTFQTVGRSNLVGENQLRVGFAQFGTP